MKKIFTLYIVALLLVACNNQATDLTVDQMVEQAVEVVKTTQPDELMKIMETEEIFTVIDVRQKDEFYYGYIPGAVNIPRGSIEFSINNATFWENEGLYMPNTDELIILVCKKGKRSILAGHTLQRMGYSNVRVLKEGWKSWEMAYPDYCEKNLEMLAGGPAKHDDGGGC
ncbi:rhodanese-like domain-containing protein [Carboxylicivirga sp. N1Y90]|uniref:rhodanese-like domain-containing protein n=1 Tax=Carboxylicivirga fragile TaxID=3417571 RepID=UPI003D358B45|nr:rhodanese-like domain-containing protein [Marinilabiliaceae bacterium N1Y90]